MLRSSSAAKTTHGISLFNAVISTNQSINGFMKRSHSSCNLVDKKENFKQCSLGHYLASKSTYYFAWHLTFAHFAESFRFDRVTCFIITAKKIQLKTRRMKCVRIAAFRECWLSNFSYYSNYSFIHLTNSFLVINWHLFYQWHPMIT